MDRLLSLESNLIQSTENRPQKSFETFRNSSTIDAIETIKFTYGPNYQIRLKYLEIVAKNPNMFEHFSLTEASRDHMRVQSGKLLFFNKQQASKLLSYEEYLKDPNKLSVISSALSTYDAAFSIKNGVHWFLYMKTVFNLGTTKHQQFIDRSVRYDDVGCFGLTEILHGSNVRGILTQAHYDHTSKQFIIHSPTKDAMKIWIGAAANIANICVIWAQLFVKTKCYGVHAFIVPLRDKSTHKLLPGVLVGDCGPKNGCNLIDNGFIMLDMVRIPVDNLLDRISQITPEGQFTSITDNQDKRFGLQLSALSGGRYMVAMNGSVMAMQALTIALRYCCIRKQFSVSKNGPQVLLLEYPLMKRRLIPLLAQNIVYLSGNMAAIFQWDQNYKNILDPKNRVVQELHAISSATKPKSGWFSLEVIKQCRQAMGGHGYSAYSKLGTLYNDHDINNTWEGDNTVLLQQATKFVFDKFVKVMKGKKTKAPLLEFLQQPPELQQVFKLSLCPHKFKAFLQAKISFKLQQTAMKMQHLNQQLKVPKYDTWNASQVFLGKQIAMTFGDLFYLNSFMEQLTKVKHQPSKKVLSDCLTLWILKCYRYDELINEQSYSEIEDKIMEYCQKLTPEALGLVEALCADQNIIGSPFANSEGKGFQRYIQHITSSNQKNLKPKWWKELVNRQINS